jgi:uncharacterized protein
MNDLVIDAFEFCRLREHREGDLSVSALPRLAEESVDKTGNIRWTLQGGSDNHGHPRLDLAISGTVRLLCQRCLTPVEIDISSNSVLILAQDEKSADEIDALLEDEPFEVVVGSHDFDVGQVIEDEALLAIPLAPKHDACSVAEVAQEAVREIEKESPFAVLKNLKK